MPRRAPYRVAAALATLATLATRATLATLATRATLATLATRAALAAAVAASWVGLGTLVGCPPPPPPATTCTGPDIGAGEPVERLPFDKDGLGADCNLAAPADTKEASAQLGTSADETLAIFGCTDGAVNADFSHEEVLVVDTTDAITVDGLFDHNGLILATSTTDCAVHATAQRQVTVLQRTGDLDVSVRRCVTPCDLPTGPE